MGKPVSPGIKSTESRSMLLNVGPQHPAMHGIVRIVTELQGETVVGADVEIGYLHRAFEKMCEQGPYNNAIPYTDRLNYVSPLINNIGYCLAVEKLIVYAAGALLVVSSSSFKTCSAIAETNDAPDAGRKTASALIESGNLYVQKGLLDKAIAAYESAIRADGKAVFAYCNLAYVLESKKQFAKAKSYLEMASKINPQDAVVWYDLGEIYGKEGDYPKAIEYYEKSHAIDPKYYKACLSLAMAYEKTRNLEKAAEFYVKALALTDDPKLKEAILRQITKTSG